MMIAIQINMAFAQLALQTCVLLPNAQTKSMISPTNGMAVINSVITQSLVLIT